ncbi:MAG: ribosomal protein L11 methyltransferase [Paraglaciecola sp.]|jgi:ribosomal protein L11 methyltransferase
MDYFQLKTTCDTEITDILIALFSQFPFNTFEENETGFSAYLPEKEWTDEIEKGIIGLKNSFDFRVEKNHIPYQNWNAIWEANFQPILVRDFCGIRADFHPPLEEVKHEIVINPKMAFGTGHHETTYMVMSLMESMDFQDKMVFDYGCGTGILAILASQLGAKTIDAVDIEPPSYENTVENAEINNISNIEPYLGTLIDIENSDYDIILANINRNVILDSLSSLFEKLKNGGTLVVSGFLKADEDLLKDSAKDAGFSIGEGMERNNWICLQLKK